MTQLFEKIKNFLLQFTGEINPTEYADSMGYNAETIQKYFRKLAKETGLEKRKDGRKVVYWRKESTNINSEAKQEYELVAHGLQVHVVLKEEVHLGCLPNITSLKNGKTKTKIALETLLGSNACISKYHAGPKGDEKTTVHGTWFWASPKYFMENQVREQKKRKLFGRKIYFKLSWGKDTIKKYGGPTLYLTCSCSIDPLDKNGFLWFEGEINSSFGIDLNKHPNVFALEGGIGIDIEKDELLFDNTINQRYPLYKDSYLEHYDKLFPDGTIKERITPHTGLSVAKYEHVANIVKQSRHAPQVIENQYLIIKAIEQLTKSNNELIKSNKQQKQSNQLFLNGVDAIIMKLNIITDDMPADYKKQRNLQRLDKEWRKVMENGS